jgi:phage repressor protein C with HTH and peptisase S24 domain
VGVDGLVFGRRPAWLQSPGLWWCKHCDRRDADMENEAMATRQTSEQAKTEAKTKVDTTNNPIRNSKGERKGRHRRSQSGSTATRAIHIGAIAAAANGAIVDEKPKRARSRTKAIPRAPTWEPPVWVLLISRQPARSGRS